MDGFHYFHIAVLFFIALYIKNIKFKITYDNFCGTKIYLNILCIKLMIRLINLHNNFAHPAICESRKLTAIFFLQLKCLCIAKGMSGHAYA